LIQFEKLTDAQVLDLTADEVQAHINFQAAKKGLPLIETAEGFGFSPEDTAPIRAAIEQRVSAVKEAEARRQGFVARFQFYRGLAGSALEAYEMLRAAHPEVVNVTGMHKALAPGWLRRVLQVFGISI
jgi:hypothetical protein